MEVSALKHAGVAGIHGRSPLLRLQSDERLIALIRRGNHYAFEALMARYQSRLLAFCRHMLSSKEDAEDVLQEVFAAAFNAIQADDRPLNVRPWLYRIARNRSLNHLRRVQPIGVDSMDVHFSEGGQTTADKVHKREDFRLLLADVQELPESQRTALLLREIDALSYDQIAEAMETTVPSVKSLLVRARVGLAEAAEARQMSCDEVRLELGEVAEGLTKMSPPVRRHLKQCERCSHFRKQLRDTNKALAAVYPVGALLMVKKLILAQFGGSAAGGGAASTAAGGAAAAGSAAAGGAASSLLGAGASAVATKAAAGLAAAAIVGVGAVEVHHAAQDPQPAPVLAQRSVATPATGGTPAAPVHKRAAAPAKTHKAKTPSALKAKVAAKPAVPTTTTTTTSTTPTTATTPAPPPTPTTETVSDTTVLPSQPTPVSHPQTPVTEPQPSDPGDDTSAGDPGAGGSDNGNGGTPPEQSSPPSAQPPPPQPLQVPAVPQP